MARGEDGNESKDAASYRETVERYLRYKGRGIPRRTWREVNKYVWWEEDGPNLILDIKSRRYMELFSKLEEGLQDDPLFNALGRSGDNVRRDRQKLYFYYTADWVLGRGLEEFIADDVVAMSQTLNLGGKLTPQAASAIAQTTLEILKNRACIEIDAARTVRADAAWESVYYKLSPWVLRAFEGSAEEETKAVVASAAAEPMARSGELLKIGSYQVLEEIAGGATSQIFKVRGMSGEIVAAKILRAELMHNLMLQTRFRDEIAMLTELNEPGVVRVFASGEEAGRPFFVMELLDGVALNTLIAGVKSLPVSTACYVAVQLAETLERIHARGWIHRDVKPGNIFVTRGGETKLMDFGIGRRVGGDGPAQTTAGYILGTPGYMAPEQILNPSQTGVASDVYSLAVTLFEMIAGQLPFGNPEQLKDWQGLLEEAPSLLRFSSVPKELAEAVGEALLRSPEARTQTMAAFRAKLLPWQDGSAESLALAVASCRHSVSSSSAATLVGIASLIPASMRGELNKARLVDLPTRRSIVEAPTMAGPLDEMPLQAAPVKSKAPKGRGQRAGSPVPPPPPLASLPPAYAASPAPQAAAAESIRNADVRNAEIREADLVASSARPQGKDMEWLWTGSRKQQEEAFQRLCGASGRLHLLFDFARRVGLWGGPGAIGRSLILREGRLILGRSASEVDLPLESRDISRQHLAFFVRFEEQGSVYAEDLSSASGSRINGERLSRRVLKDGDLVQAGENEIRIHVLPLSRTLFGEMPDELP
jgi:serine/threonine protein kinase